MAKCLRAMYPLNYLRLNLEVNNHKVEEYPNKIRTLNVLVFACIYFHGCQFLHILHSFHVWWKLDDFAIDTYVLLISIGRYSHANDKMQNFSISKLRLL